MHRSRIFYLDVENMKSEQCNQQQSNSFKNLTHCILFSIICFIFKIFIICGIGRDEGGGDIFLTIICTTRALFSYGQGGRGVYVYNNYMFYQSIVQLRFMVFLYIYSVSMESLYQQIPQLLQQLLTQTIPISSR